MEGERVQIQQGKLLAVSLVTPRVLSSLFHNQRWTKYFLSSREIKRPRPHDDGIISTPT